MQLLHEAKVSYDEHAVFFRTSRLYALMSLLLCTLPFAFGAWFLDRGLWGSAWYEIVPLMVIGIPALLAFLLLFSSMWRAWIASFRSDNWVMIVSPHAVYAKYRSHLNHHFDAESFTVVRFSLDDIVMAGKRIEAVRTVGFSRGSHVTRWLRFLELTLTDEIDLAPLAEAIATERQREAPSERLAFGVTSRHKVRHYPVKVLAERRAVCIEWHGDRMLRELARNGVPIATPHQVRLSCTGDALEALETQILDLLERGMYLSAIRLAQRAYGCSYTEAKQFIDDLGASPTPTSQLKLGADAGE